MEATNPLGKKLSARVLKHFARDFGLVTEALWDLGALRVPEIVAATRLSEDRAHELVAVAVRAGWLNRRAEDGEISRSYDFNHLAAVHQAVLELAQTGIVRVLPPSDRWADSSARRGWRLGKAG